VGYEFDDFFDGGFSQDAHVKAKLVRRLAGPEEVEI